MRFQYASKRRSKGQSQLGGGEGEYGEDGAVLSNFGSLIKKNWTSLDADGNRFIQFWLSPIGKKLEEPGMKSGLGDGMSHIYTHTYLHQKENGG